MCAFSIRGGLLSASFKKERSMDDLLMLVLIGVLFAAGWGLAAFCDRLSGRGRV
jgi:hypothetical protein